MVNAIPDKTVLESYVRGSNFDAICEANLKVNQALCGAALSIGTNVEIIDTPGYAPHINDENLMQLSAEAAKAAIPEYPYKVVHTMGSGSTDMGDLSCIMPIVHPYAGGAAGRSHGSNYKIADPVAACVASAKLQLALLLLLLDNGAKRAYQIIEEYQPRFASKEEFLSYVDSLNACGDRIAYGEDGVAHVRL
jgi:metal-dependent amidase/aminoacylase/carboxypeptidase family protein